MIDPILHCRGMFAFLALMFFYISDPVVCFVALVYTKFDPFEFACMTLCLLKTLVIIHLDSLKRSELMRATIEARKNNYCVGSNAMIYLPDAHFFTFSPSNILLKINIVV